MTPRRPLRRDSVNKSRRRHKGRSSRNAPSSSTSARFSVRITAKSTVGVLLLPLFGQFLKESSRKPASPRSRRSIGPGLSYVYSPSCREEVVSETRLPV